MGEPGYGCRVGTTFGMVTKGTIMTKQGLIKEISGKAGITRTQAELALEAFVGSVKAELASGGEVTVTGLGAFRVKDREAREGRNPATGQVLTIPARKVVRFMPGKDLRESVNGGANG